MAQIDEVTGSITTLSQKGQMNSNELHGDSEDLNKAMELLKELVRGRNAA